MEFRQLQKASLTDAEAEELARLLTLVDPRRLRTDPAVSTQLARESLREPVPTYVHNYWGLFDGEQLIGLSEAAGPINAENADVAEIGVWADPGAIGHGVERQLFDHVEAIERERGRTRFWGWGELGDQTTRTFWEGELGYSLAYDERISRCDLHAVDESMMHDWIGRASERASHYHLLRAESPFDDLAIEYFAQGLEAMNDAPLDDLQHEHETFDSGRAREIEDIHVSTNSEYRAIFAIETATGDLAGYTATRVPRSEPAYGKQGDTVTVAAHRNQGIGRWLKADMWRWLRDERPEVQYLDTGNAESNRPMLAINEAMGFHDIMHQGVWHHVASE